MLQLHYVFLVVDYLETSISMELPDVTGVEPAHSSLINLVDFLGFLFPFEITSRDIWTSDYYFTMWHWCVFG